ncbi:MAG: F0F1 ATP synthase subunit epsilon, partial [Candidatus Nanopelagicales bacterium]
MSELHVNLVAVDRKIWSGSASMVVAKTLEGEIGILPRHEPVLALL